MNHTGFLQLLEHRREHGKLLGTGGMVPLVDVAPYRSSNRARKAPATCTWSRERRCIIGSSGGGDGVLNLCCRYTFEKSAYHVLDCAQSVLENSRISDFHVYLYRILYTKDLQSTKELFDQVVIELNFD